MYLILHATVPSEPHEAPSTAVVEINREQARAILDLHARSMRYLEDLQASGLADSRCPLSAGVGDSLPTFRLMDLSDFDVDVEVTNQNPISELTTPELLPDDLSANYFVENHRIQVDRDGVWLSAEVRFTFDEVNTTLIPLALIESIANATASNIPAIGLPVAC